MPDVHLSHSVCVGTVVATDAIIYPDAVGGDIGCGISTLRFEGDPERVHQGAAALMERLRRSVPILRHRQRQPLPTHLMGALSNPAIERMRDRDGAVQFGTVGRGNHFVEIQSDRAGSIWMSVHSGSRAMGPYIQRHHARGEARSLGLRGDSERGRAYLHDHDWAVDYARLNREQITLVVGALLMRLFDLRPEEASHVDCTHNMVRPETVAGKRLLVHRKGAISARNGEQGIIPGSMGAATYLVVGRGCESALNSSSHGAGRMMSRTEARRHIGVARLRKETAGVHINDRVEARLVEEAPSAYKPIAAVMRAQGELTKIVGVLHPVLNYKGV